LLSSNDDADSLNRCMVEAVACSGLGPEERSIVLQTIQQALQDEGVTFGVHSDLIEIPSINDKSLPVGALGRILLLRSAFGEEDDNEILQGTLSDAMDPLLYGDHPALAQPVLISIQPDLPSNVLKDVQQAQLYFASLVAEQVEQYELVQPLVAATTHAITENCMIPSIHTELDGARTQFESTTGKSFWDTSTVLVFDDLVSDDLRRGLLNVVLGSHDDSKSTWNDVELGPDPKRWVRGGLLDIPDDKNEEEENNDTTTQDGPCWGLRDEMVEELCFQPHDAVNEFESILSQLFPEFIVSRLPEAVFGDCVSPLTANAPTSGDTFNYHIDGDPNLMPPSPWTDVFGRYPNRVRGRPRFVSMLIYLSDEWNAELWGAPTRFLDIPTDTFTDILPRPGRAVLMDQDVSHTVVAPNASAGKRPRYSMVWKIILHPKETNQDMADLAGSRRSMWPEPILFGSAGAVTQS
jgi:hypothetical protein